MNVHRKLKGSRVIDDTLEEIFERWEDPGDYPNGLAAGPLPSYDYFAGIGGWLVIALTDPEVRQYEAEGYEFADDLARTSMQLKDLPPDFEWDFTLDGNVLTCEPKG